jgi:thioredoxin 1
MKTSVRILILAGLAVAVSLAIVLKRRETPETTAHVRSAAGLPKLLDLGADKCIPCKAMAPILARLKQEYSGKFEVEFIDVWKDESAGKRYGVEIIPTQIFFDANGKERFRHVGFFSREDILAKWKELGVEFKSEVRGPKADGK